MLPGAEISGNGAYLRTLRKSWILGFKVGVYVIISSASNEPPMFRKQIRTHTYIYIYILYTNTYTYMYTHKYMCI